MIAVVFAPTVAGDGAGRSGTAPLGTTVLLAAVSTAFHTGYAVLLDRAYRSAHVSAVYPASRGLATILVTVAGAVLLGQAISGIAIAGVAVMVVVIALLLEPATRTRNDGADSSPSSRTRHGTAMWGVAIAVTTAAYTTFDGWAVASAGVDPPLYDGVAACTQCVLLSAVAGPSGMVRGLELLRRTPGPIVCLAMLIPLSTLLGLYATLHAPLGVVSVVRSLSLIWTALAAAVVLHEPLGRRRILATGVATIAIAVIAFGTPV